VARSAGTLRALADHLQPLLALGEARSLGAALQGAGDRSRRNRISPRCHHRSGAPGRRGRKRGVRRNHLGRSRGGVSTKIHAVTTTDGKPLHVALTQGHRHEAIKAEELIEHARGRACIADSGYSSDAIVEAIRARGMKPSSRRTRRTARSYASTGSSTRSGTGSSAASTRSSAFARSPPVTRSPERTSSPRCTSPASGSGYAIRDSP
jgi:hypothetical protein